MAVGAINTLTSLASESTTANAVNSSSAAQADALSMNFSTYLKILTTQLKNQDPTNATDPNQFTQELIMMQQVQAQITNNEAIDALSKATTTNSLATGVGYIGNYVRAATEDGDFSLQDGSAQIGYTLDAAATASIITIKDSSGATVASLTGGTSHGDNYVTWDGTTKNGTKATDGAYTFMVTSIDSNGDSVDVTNSTALYKVTSVESNNDGTLTLNAGNLSLLSTDVTGVFNSATRPAATPGTILSAT